MTIEYQLSEDIKSRFCACCSVKEKIETYLTDMIDLHEFYEGYIEYDDDTETDGWIYYNEHDHSESQKWCRISDLKNVYDATLEDTLTELARNILYVDELYENTEPMQHLDENQVEFPEELYTHEPPYAEGYTWMYTSCGNDDDSCEDSFMKVYVDFLEQEGVRYSLDNVMRLFGATHKATKYNDDIYFKVKQ